MKIYLNNAELGEMKAAAVEAMAATGHMDAAHDINDAVANTTRYGSLYIDDTFRLEIKPEAVNDVCTAIVDVLGDYREHVTGIANGITGMIATINPVGFLVKYFSL